MASETHRAIDAIWRIESPRLIAGLTRIVRDVGLAEERAQDALVAALESWPEPSMKSYHLLAGVRGDLLAKLGRFAEARAEFERAASLRRNARERELLRERAAACARERGSPQPG
jgi:predicted RNA polymerase sigma factor